MADQDYNGDTGDHQYDGDQQMYAQDGGYENRSGGDRGQGEERKKDDDERKIFVGGISWETTQKDLEEYFQKFGAVADTTLKTDPDTGRSRGFGFVLFTDKSSVDAVVNASEPHTLHGRTIDPKKAHARPKPEPVKKVFVGGVDTTVSEEELRQYFGQFGKIVEVDLPYDKIKNARRAFCFISFEDEAAVEKACHHPKQTIASKEVDVKRATPRQDSHGGGWNQQQWSGGYGGGRGGRGGTDRGGRGGRGRGRGGSQGQSWGGQSGGWGGQGNYDYYGTGYGQSQYGSGAYNGNSQQYYDYSSPSSYGGYGAGYDNYYQGWNNYNQGAGSYGSYGSGGSSQQQTQQASNYGKQKTTGQGVGRGGGYHPYSRQ